MSLHHKALAGEIDYPETDGKPMAETDKHRNLMAELIAELEEFFRSDPDVYVSGNLLLYYVEGQPGKNTAPDIFVVRGIPKHERRTYKLWEEGRAPDIVIEISSRRTWGDDLQRKWRLFERLGVTEYFLFDPEYDYLYEPLIGYRLVDGEYAQLEVRDGRVRSETLGLELVDTGQTLRLFNPQTGQFLPTRQEIIAAREQAEARAMAEAEARAQAEAELAQLRAEIKRLHGQA